MGRLEELSEAFVNSEQRKAFFAQLRNSLFGNRTTTPFARASQFIDADHKSEQLHVKPDVHSKGSSKFQVDGKSSEKLIKRLSGVRTRNIRRGDTSSVRPKEFEKQKTTKDAEEWAVKANIADEIRYGTLHPDIANKVNETVFNHLNDFPEARDRLNFLGSSVDRREMLRQTYARRLFVSKKAAGQLLAISYKKTPGGYPGLPSDMDSTWWNQSQKTANKYYRNYISNNNWAMAWYDKEGSFGRGISFNPKQMSTNDNVKSLQTSLMRGVKTKFHPDGGHTVKSIVDHELGHHMDKLLRIRSDPKFKEWHKKITSKGWAYVKDNLSEYANHKDDYDKDGVNEFIAEAWTEYRNSDKPRPIAKQLGEYVEKKYREKFGDHKPHLSFQKKKPLNKISNLDAEELKASFAQKTYDKHFKS